MESEQRLKRKRIYRPYTRAQFLSRRSLILCLSFFVFLMFLSSERFPIRTVSFHPVVSVPSLSILSKNSLQDSFHAKLRFPLSVEDRVLFPDHLLLLVSDKIDEAEKLDCVYHKVLNHKDVVRQRVLSVDEFDGFRSVVRCPLPAWNYSVAAGLMWRGHGVDYSLSLRSNRTVHSWDRLVYEAAFDGKTAVVFAKGLNLRPHKESDPNRFMCQFGLKNSDEEDEGFVVLTEAIVAAQEVVRCSLPSSIRNNPDSAQGIRVTVVLASRNDVKLVRMPSAVRFRNSRSRQKGMTGNSSFVPAPCSGTRHRHCGSGLCTIPGSELNVGSFMTIIVMMEFKMLSKNLIFKTIMLADIPGHGLKLKRQDFHIVL